MKGDEVWFSEVSPRPHDTGLVTWCRNSSREFALHARAILGLPVSTEMASPGASAVIYGGVEARRAGFDGVDEALTVPGSELRLFGKPESFVKRRMGVALARGADTDEARAGRNRRRRGEAETSSQLSMAGFSRPSMREAHSAYR